ncbi:hypothetical protein P168DRAFT_36515 [Aspergillus campestris IBT 28561]|uniref:Uncharacterized protein n=1 Tax=Aspergillus campestris (strain IBT 28561) TaxID=1392248 RepID=A0A2I1CW72_ASPC2|nr:uncharacterized protein P168DRAFT_36515 [Aspergillus campestris IBT 28561]PKY01873.1 hypothetical protein P168DRAFT_36515 [Aspergillus campestris IBT 28561]
MMIGCCARTSHYCHVRAGIRIYRIVLFPLLLFYGVLRIDKIPIKRPGPLWNYGTHNYGWHMGSGPHTLLPPVGFIRR